MDVVGCTEGFLQRGLTIGTFKVGAALKKNVNDLWKPMLTLIY
jgi:hypothetical protein